MCKNSDAKAMLSDLRDMNVQVSPELKDWCEVTAEILNNTEDELAKHIVALQQCQHKLCSVLGRVQQINTVLLSDKTSNKEKLASIKITVASVLAEAFNNSCAASAAEREETKMEKDVNNKIEKEEEFHDPLVAAWNNFKLGFAARLLKSESESEDEDEDEDEIEESVETFRDPIKDWFTRLTKKWENYSQANTLPEEKEANTLPKEKKVRKAATPKINKVVTSDDFEALPKKIRDGARLNKKEQAEIEANMPGYAQISSHLKEGSTRWHLYQILCRMWLYADEHNRAEIINALVAYHDNPEKLVDSIIKVDSSLVPVATTLKALVAAA